MFHAYLEPTLILFCHESGTTKSTLRMAIKSLRKFGNLQTAFVKYSGERRIEW